MNFTLHMIFFDWHHSGTQFFLGNVYIFFRPENSPAQFSGGGKHPKSHFFPALFDVDQKTVSVLTLNLTSAENQSVCGR